MENENLTKSHGKVIEFWIFMNVYHISFEKFCWLPTFLQLNGTGSPHIAVKYLTCKNGLSKKTTTLSSALARTNLVVEAVQF